MKNLVFKFTILVIFFQLCFLKRNDSTFFKKSFVKTNKSDLINITQEYQQENSKEKDSIQKNFDAGLSQTENELTASPLVLKDKKNQLDRSLAANRILCYKPVDDNFDGNGIENELKILRVSVKKLVVCSEEISTVLTSTGTINDQIVTRCFSLFKKLE